MKILVTGVAGFIGMHVCMKLLENNISTIGIDNINDYYDINLKKSRINHIIKSFDKFIFKKIDLCDKQGLEKLVSEHKIDIIINLAAQAGVRYSIENPHSYIDSNINGFLNILEIGRHKNLKHIIFASTSSVYGLNSKLPFREIDSTDHPLSIYAASKKANELMAHSYSSLYGLPTTGLRFFTVYGPWGRPDMALFIFTKAILENKPINVFNNGNHSRDFTFIDDIVSGIYELIDKPPIKNSKFDYLKPELASSDSPYQVFNIGNGEEVNLLTYIEAIENHLGKKAIKNFLPMQKGDVNSTLADTSKLQSATNFKSKTSIDEGVKKFLNWYKDYYGIRKQ